MKPRRRTKLSGAAGVADALGSLLSAFVFAVVVTAGAPTWLPPGAAGIDHILIPIICFPVVWIAFALALYSARKRRRSWCVVGSIAALHLALIVRGFVQGG